MKVLTSVSELKREGFPETLIMMVLHSSANDSGRIGFRDNGAANAKWRIWRSEFEKEVRLRCGR